MAILEPRKRVIDVFVNKELAKPCRTLIMDTDTYRALQGQKIRRITPPPTDKKIAEMYQEYLKMLD